MSGLLAILLTAADPDLVAAEQAWAHGDYEKVTPRLEKVFAHALPRAELVRAYALEGHVRVAFDKLDLATLAFRRLLGVDAQFLLEPEASPKLLTVFAEARRLGAIAPAKGSLIEPLKALEIPIEVPPPAPEPEKPRSLWWLWTGIAVVAVGAAAGAGVWYFERPIVPGGSLGTGQLK